MSFYPINPDTAIESFLLLDQEQQKAVLGRTYSISELVPLNYKAVMNQIDINEFVPLREFCYVYQDPQKPNDINNEFDNSLQSGSLGVAFAQLLNYYKITLLEQGLGVAAGVITEIKTDLVPYNNPTQVLGENYFSILHKLKVEWFVVPGSQFS